MKEGMEEGRRGERQSKEEGKETEFEAALTNYL